jgi:hypothetical protein
MNFPTDYVKPADRLGKLYDYQANHYRFQRQPQDHRWLERHRSSRGLRLMTLGILLAILAVVIRW